MLSVAPGRVKPKERLSLRAALQHHVFHVFLSSDSMDAQFGERLHQSLEEQDVQF